MQHTLEEDLLPVQVLKLLFPDSSNRTLQNWIKWGRVSADGKPISKNNVPIKKGQTLTLSEKPLQTVENIPILYQDRYFVVIDKPHGLLSVPADKPEQSALNLLKIGFKTTSFFAVHRLDQDCSGALVFARSEQAKEKLSALFEAHDLIREYIAIVEGHLPNKQGFWESYLREKENYSVEVTTQELGKYAKTHYEVLRYTKKFSYLRLRLETGKKHQIRVHTSHAGYPILGDKRYGSLINPFKRLCLHSFRLCFVHPFTGKSMEFTPQEKRTLKGYPTHFPFVV